MQSQVKAAVCVNQEMLRFYWSLGKDISERKMDNKYGSHFYENLNRDLVTTLGIKKGFSPSTLKYTKYFYNLYSPLFINGQQPADDSDNPILQQPAEKVIDQIIPMFKTILNCCLAFHGRTKIIDKVQGDSMKAMFFIRKVLWKRTSRVRFCFYLCPHFQPRANILITYKSLEN